MKHCCICGQLFEGYGNNPAPVETRGECCDDCNINIVVPRRLLDAKKRRYGQRRTRSHQRRCNVRKAQN